MTVTPGTRAHPRAARGGVLAGTERGPRRDVVLLNAGAALVAAGRAADLAAGVARAAQVLDAGAASLLLQRLRVERRSSDEASAARAATEVRA